MPQGVTAQEEFLGGDVPFSPGSHPFLSQADEQAKQAMTTEQSLEQRCKISRTQSRQAKCPNSCRGVRLRDTYLLRPLILLAAKCDISPPRMLHWQPNRRAPARYPCRSRYHWTAHPVAAARVHPRALQRLVAAGSTGPGQSCRPAEWLPTCLADFSNVHVTARTMRSASSEASMAASFLLSLAGLGDTAAASAVSPATYADCVQALLSSMRFVP